MRHADDGSGTVLSLAAVSIVCVAAAATWGVLDGVVAHQRALAAADLAALAGAQHLAGGDSPCDVAARVAQANGTSIADCAVDGADVIVTVVTPAPTLLARLAALAGAQELRVKASARAGPAAGEE